MQIAYVCRAVGSYGWSMQAEHAVLAFIPACFVAAAEASSAFRCARSAVRALHAAGLLLMVSAMQLAGEPHGGPAGAERAVLEPEQPVRGGHRQLPLHTDGSQYRRRHRHKLALLRQHLPHVRECPHCSPAAVLHAVLVLKGPDLLGLPAAAIPDVWRSGEGKVT